MDDSILQITLIYLLGCSHHMILTYPLFAHIRWLCYIRVRVCLH